MEKKKNSPSVLFRKITAKKSRQKAVFRYMYPDAGVGRVAYFIMLRTHFVFF